MGDITRQYRYCRYWVDIQCGSDLRCPNIEGFSLLFDYCACSSRQFDKILIFTRDTSSSWPDSYRRPAGCGYPRTLQTCNLCNVVKYRIDTTDVGTKVLESISKVK